MVPLSVWGPASSGDGAGGLVCCWGGGGVSWARAMGSEKEDAGGKKEETGRMVWVRIVMI